MENMKKWELLVEANSFDGSQTFACEAVDEEEALAKFKAGLCEIIEVNVEVIGLDENPFDIEESDDITSRLSNDVNDRLVEENAELREILKKLIGNGIDLLNVDDVEDEEDAASIHAKFNDVVNDAGALLAKHKA